jgi:26S proteasome regulatory subunit N5
LPRYAITLKPHAGCAQAEQIQSNLQAAIEKLTVLEKQTRQVCRFHPSIRFPSFTIPSQASDLASTSRILIAIVTICKESGDWGLLNEQVLLLSKKHGQLKQATTKMVQVVMGFINEVTNAEKKLSVIETLRTVTEGKVLWMPSAVWGTKLI